jgi:hypothetical protein
MRRRGRVVVSRVVKLPEVCSVRTAHIIFGQLFVFSSTKSYIETSASSFEAVTRPSATMYRQLKPGPDISTTPAKRARFAAFANDFPLSHPARVSTFYVNDAISHKPNRRHDRHGALTRIHGPQIFKGCLDPGRGPHIHRKSPLIGY